MVRAMVTRWGLSDKLGPLMYAENEMGKDEFSNATSEQIDQEMRRIISECYSKAQNILEENVDVLHAMKDALMEYETIDKDQVDDLMNRRDVRPPKGWKDSTDDSSGSETQVTKAEEKPEPPEEGGVSDPDLSST